MGLDQDASGALWLQITREVTRAAGANRWVSRKEQRRLGPFLFRVAERLREEGGRGARVRSDLLVDRAVAEVQAAWRRARGWLTPEEQAAVAEADPEIGAWTAAVAATLGQDPVRSWFDAFPFATQRFAEEGLPDGRRVDARKGRAGRRGLPEALRDAFDFYHRAEAADLGSVSLHEGSVGGMALWAIFVTTDGDDAYLEVRDADGTLREGARLLAGSIVAWDQFPGQVRLAPFWLRLDQPKHEEGLSEDFERAQAGQPSLGFKGELRIPDGRLVAREGVLVALDLGGFVLAPGLRPWVFAAFSWLWEVHLRHRAGPPGPSGGTVVEIRSNGVLSVGPFLRRPTKQTFRVADWRDIDDGSYVLYFDSRATRPVLRIVQFDN